MPFRNHFMLLSVGASLLCLILGLQAATPDWLVDPSSFVARATPSTNKTEIVLENGLVRRVIRLQPNAATVAFDNLATGESLLRSVRPEAVIEINGRPLAVGGLVGQPVHNYLSRSWLDNLRADPAALRFTRFEIDHTKARFPWRKRPEWLTSDPPWPAPGAAVTLVFEGGTNVPAATVEVHYEIYDGLPLISKWLVVRNTSGAPITLNRMTVEQLAVVEPESIVDGAASNFRGAYRSLDVFSEYSFGGAT